MPVTPVELLPPGQKAIGNSYDNMTYSTKLGADVSESLTLNGVARYTDATLRFTGDTFDPVTLASFPAAAQSTQTVHQLFTRGEAVWSILDDRMKSYFGVNYTNHWNHNISPGDAMPTITTGDRVKYDWHTTTRLAPNNNVIIGAEHETETLQTATVSAQNVNKAGYMELQSQFVDRVFFTANVRQDDNERFGEHPTFRLTSAVIVPVTDTKFREATARDSRRQRSTSFTSAFLRSSSLRIPTSNPRKALDMTQASSSPCSTIAFASGRPTSATTSRT